MSWLSPLAGYENAEPLPDKMNPDGKSLYNPPAARSAAYDEYPKPIDSSNNPFDFHGTAHFSLDIPFVADDMNSVLHAIGFLAGRVCSEASRANPTRVP